MDTRQAFPAAAQVAATLIRHPAVGAAWDRESACADMSVGGLAHHLAAQVFLPLDLLAVPPTGEAPIELTEHYERAAWVTGAHDDEVNVAIRETEEERAEGGHAALVARLNEALAALPERLAAPRDPDTVHLPWQGWSLRTGHFLVSRMMEVVVHADDLAASIDEPTPEVPNHVIGPVLALLTSLSVRRHGQAAVVRTLTRPQRAPDGIAAF